MPQLARKLAAYENKTPELVFEWCDDITGAKGWLVIDSLKNGAAGGGTRMRKGLDKNEVVSLAKTMGMKFSMSTMPLGGAKSGIDFDPKDPRKKEVLERWYAAITPLLKSYYGTGGDLNVDELHEVIPITHEFGVLHPQEGALRGYFGEALTEKDLEKRLRQLQVGVSKIIEDTNHSPDVAKKYTIADMITGHGVAESIKHYYSTYGGDITNKKALIQGYGSVGGSTAYYLAKTGCKVIGIIEVDCALIKPEGFSLDELKKLLLYRNDISAPKIGSKIPLRNLDQAWSIGAEVFVPAAASRLVDRKHLDTMIASGLELIAPGANVPFNDQDIFYGKTCKYADEKVSVLPDFISNCGAAEIFRYLMEKDAIIVEENMFKNISDTIGNLIKKAHNENQNKTGITKAFLQMALDKLLENRRH